MGTSRIQLCNWFQYATKGLKDGMLPLVEKYAGRKNDSSETALMVAAREGHADIVQLLLQKEATVLNNDGECAMHIAVKRGLLDIVQILMPFEGHIYTKEGNTSLILAANAGDSILCQYLVRFPTQWYDKRGFSVLAHVVSLGNHALTELIGKEMPIPKDVLVACTEIALRRGDTAMCTLLNQLEDYQISHTDAFSQMSNSITQISKSVIHTPNADVHTLSSDPLTALTLKTRTSADSYLDAVGMATDEIEASVLSNNYVSKKTVYKNNEIRSMNESRHRGHSAFPPTLACTVPIKVSLEDYLEYSQSISRSRAMPNTTRSLQSHFGDSEGPACSYTALSNHELDVQRAINGIREAHDLVEDTLRKVDSPSNGYSSALHPSDTGFHAHQEKSPAFQATIANLSAASSILEQSDNILQQSLQLDKESTAISHAVETYKEKTMDDLNNLICNVVEFAENKLHLIEKSTKSKDPTVESSLSQNSNTHPISTLVKADLAKNNSELSQSATSSIQSLISSDTRLNPSLTAPEKIEATNKSLVPNTPSTANHITPMPTTETNEDRLLRSVQKPPVSMCNSIQVPLALSEDPVMGSIQRQSVMDHCPLTETDPAFYSSDIPRSSIDQNFSGLGKTMVSMILSGQFSQGVSEEHVLLSGIQRPVIDSKIIETSYKRVIPEYMGNYKFTKQLINCTTGRFTEMMDAVMRNDINCVKALLPYQGRLQDENGSTALMFAAEKGLNAIVSVLTRAEIGMTDIYGQTALMRAAKNNRPSTCELLLEEAGLMTSENHPNKEGLTALCFACMMGSIDCVRVLLGKEAKLPYGPSNSPEALSSSAEIKHLVQLYLE